MPLDAEVHGELRALERLLNEAIAAVRHDTASALDIQARLLSSLQAQVASMTVERDVERHEEELKELRGKVEKLLLWKENQRGAQSVSAKGQAFWEGVSTRVFGAIVTAGLLGLGGMMLSLYQMLSGAGATP